MTPIKTPIRTTALALALILSPLAALALPAVGDVIGTNAADASKALDAAGCPALGFEAEDGKIEAQCTDAATGKVMDIYIDPETGTVTALKASDD